jgi:hypothetical protein
MPTSPLYYPLLLQIVQLMHLILLKEEREASFAIRDRFSYFLFFAIPFRLQCASLHSESFMKLSDIYKSAQ